MNRHIDKFPAIIRKSHNNYESLHLYM